MAASGAAQNGRVVFVLDCDNTLLDNDGVKADMDAHLRAIIGPDLTTRFWQIYEEVRQLKGTVDLPTTFARFEQEHPDPTTAAQVRAAIMEYPFANRLFPDTLAALHYLHEIGRPVIVSDGDPVYQPLKLRNSGLDAAVDDQTVVYTHKEDHIPEILARWPAPFYVAVDDKGRLLTAFKRRMPDRFVTIHILRGHYAHEGEPLDPPPDITINTIGDLRNYTIADLQKYLRYTK